MATRVSTPPKVAEKIQPSIASEENIDEVLKEVLKTLGPEGAVSYLQGQILYYTLLAPVSNEPSRTAFKARWYADQLACYFGA